jgi:hypothetical protein
VRTCAGGAVARIRPGRSGVPVGCRPDPVTVHPSLSKERQAVSTASDCPLTGRMGRQGHCPASSLDRASTPGRCSRGAVIPARVTRPAGSSPADPATGYPVDHCPVLPIG